MPTGRIYVDRAPANASHPIMGPSQRRIALTFFGPSAGQVRLSDNPIASIDDGFPIFSGSQAYQITYDTHGELVHHGWFAFNDAGLHPVSWIETLK